MTSNVGSTTIAKGGSNRIGFTFEEEHQDIYLTLKALVMGILSRLVGDDNHMYTYHVDTLQWIVDTNLLAMLVDALSSTRCLEVHQNATTLCAITHF